MNAIILTQAQADALRAARGPNDARILEPRRLQDGRLILNADILDDPFFSDPARPWAAVLGITQPQPVEETVADPVIDTGAPQGGDVINESPVEVATPLSIVTLTDADLEEPA